MSIAGDIIIAAGVIFMLLGMIGYIRYKHFFDRILITAKIDTVASITILIGVAFRHGFSFFTLKVLLLIGMLMIINPLSSHMMAGCAFSSGLRPEKQDGENP